MIDPELLKILCCPETHQPLSPANPDMIASLNTRIREGRIVNRANRPVNEPIDGALIREDGRFAYPIRHEIPIMLIDEALPLSDSQAPLAAS